MKDNMTRRRFLKVSGITVATPSVIKGVKRLFGYDAGTKTSLNRGAQKKGKLDERLECISDVWDVPGSYSLGVEGWNESGLWRFFADSNTGEISWGFLFDYRERPFMKYDVGFSKPRTLAQLRADGVPWEEIDRLHYEGVSNKPKYKLFLA
jgi:hypothetical protein